ncbi:MAG: type II toxin-antitoxin system VapC family toxin [Candidatus Limnocylindrales bacterium]
MIFIDSNVPMYLIGAEHPLRSRSRERVEELVAANETLCTDAEVLQEILHRYTSIGRSEFIDPAFEALLSIVDVVHPIERADVERARRLMRTLTRLSARDALHLAVMQSRDVGQILSFDGGFDRVPGIERIGA